MIRVRTARTTLLATAASVLAQVPDPGSGKKPPGFEKFNTILSWAAWIAIGVCVLGLIICGGKMAIEHRSGGGGGLQGQVGSVMIGCVLIGTAAGIVQALI